MVHGGVEYQVYRPVVHGGYIRAPYHRPPPPRPRAVLLRAAVPPRPRPRRRSDRPSGRPSRQTSCCRFQKHRPTRKAKPPEPWPPIDLALLDSIEAIEAGRPESTRPPRPMIPEKVDWPGYGRVAVMSLKIQFDQEDLRPLVHLAVARGSGPHGGRAGKAQRPPGADGAGGRGRCWGSSPMCSATAGAAASCRGRRSAAESCTRGPTCWTSGATEGKSLTLA